MHKQDLPSAVSREIMEEGKCQLVIGGLEITVVVERT